jgi:hypothetical protein
MPQPLVVTVPHRLAKAEALRRIKSGLGSARANYHHVLQIHDETWSGDHVSFAVSALGQHASGSLDVRESEVELSVTLPWLLAKIAERFTPLIRKEGVLLLEKK